MKRPNIEKLDALIKRGPLFFVLRHGVLGWGVLTGVLFSIFFPLLMQAFGQRMTSHEILANTVRALLIFPIGGIAFGLLMWPTLLFLRRRVKSRQQP
jgi:hypothetical protein